MATYTPPGWPAGVHPPGSDDFESTAVGWLLDVVPPDYRLHGVLRRYPVALATMARYHSRACVEGARQGYRTARTELAGALPPHAIDTVLAAYRKEGARLAAIARAVGLVERALRGEVLTPKMSSSTIAPPRTSPPRMTEPQAAPPLTAGPQPAGPQPAGPQPAEPQPAEPQPAKPKVTAPKAAAPRNGEPKDGQGAARADTARTAAQADTARTAARTDTARTAAQADTARTAARAGPAVRQRAERQRPAR
jgi:hypothetical protein